MPDYADHVVWGSGWGISLAGSHEYIIIIQMNMRNHDR